MLQGFYPHASADEHEPAFQHLRLAQQADMSGVRAVLAYYNRPCKLSAEVVDLLDRMLQTDPAQRPSAQAISHAAWLQPSRPETPAAPPPPTSSLLLTPDSKSCISSLTSLKRPQPDHFSLEAFIATAPSHKRPRPSSPPADVDGEQLLSFADVCVLFDGWAWTS